MFRTSLGFFGFLPVAMSGIALFSSSVVAQVRLESGSFGIQASGRLAEVEFFCQSRNRAAYLMKVEQCEDVQVRPTRYDRLVGWSNTEIRRVRLEREGRVWEFAYLGREGKSDSFDLLPLLDDGFLTFRYQLLGPREHGTRRVIEEGEFTVHVDLDVLETGWSEQFTVIEELGSSCALGPNELCRRYFMNQPRGIMASVEP